MNVTFSIRVAEKEDFFHVNNDPKYGTVFFLKNSKEEFDKQPYYFTKDIDKAEFKKWFKNKQVYVFTRLFEEVEINN